MDLDEELNKVIPHTDCRLWDKGQVLTLMGRSYDQAVEDIAAYIEFAEWPPYSKEQMLRMVRYFKKARPKSLLSEKK